MGAVCVLASTASGGPRALVDTTRSPHARMYMVNLGDVRWEGGLMAQRFDICRRSMVPRMWELFQDDNESHAWANFLLAAGMGKGRDGRHHGPPFSDGDFLKWFEGVAQVYALTRDPELDALMDRILSVVSIAQREDGYLQTRTIIPQRQGELAREFQDPSHFETYNMGHLITAACVHWRATGKTSALDLARKAGDYLHTLAVSSPEALARNAICPSHYMGAVELYRATGEKRYLDLAQRLVDGRSLVENGTDQNQDRVPFRDMTQAVGHAVRANYLYAGVTDLTIESGEPALRATLEKLARDVAGRKLYLTGATGALYDGASPDGSSKHGSIQLVHQAYGRDYQLPNATAYNETCATIGHLLWSWRMLLLTGEAQYADLVEQALYNGVLPAVDLAGRDYFYVNPLRKLQDFRWPLRWSRTRQPNYPTSFCCPPNVVRTIAQAQNYAYTLSPETVWVNLYGASTLTTSWPDGSRLELRQETDYPWDAAVRLVIVAAPQRPFTMRLRIPGWAGGAVVFLAVNGRRTDEPRKPGTYCAVRRAWRAGDTVDLDLAFKPSLWEANPLVEDTFGQTAVRNGPLVYCLESQDLPAGVRLSDIALSMSEAASGIVTERETIAGTEVVTLGVPALALQRSSWPDGLLYRPATATPPRPIRIKMLPYFAWGNRGEGEMTVWLPAHYGHRRSTDSQR
jgi:DUF1680 family protein